MLAGGRVVHALRDLGDNLPGQLGVDARNQRGGNHEAGAQLIGEARRFDAGVQPPAVFGTLVAELVVVLAGAPGRLHQEGRFALRTTTHAATTADTGGAQLGQPRLVGRGRVAVGLLLQTLAGRCDAGQGVLLAKRRPGRCAGARARATATRRIDLNGAACANGFLELLHLHSANALQLVGVDIRRQFARW
ncbi:hypothetical protein D9M68_669470 [compost metagenome]